MNWERAVVATKLGALTLPRDDAIFPVLCRDGEWEPEEAEMLQSVVRQGDNFVDVGAHAGYFSVMAANLGVSHVHALEPVPELANMCRVNLARFADRCDVYMLAAGSRNELRSMWLSPYGNSGDNRLGKWDASDTQLMVEVQRLDAIFNRIDVLKIDAQGWELEVLKGLGDLRPRAIIAEVWDEGGVSEHELISSFLKLGYSTIVEPRDEIKQRGYWSLMAER